MRFPEPLIVGTLVKRYKRFLADVELGNGDIVTAHCANTGSMLSVSGPGSTVWLSPANNPKRRLRFTWELIDTGSSLVGINTSIANRLVEEAVEQGNIAELSGYDRIRREVRYGKNSRIDLLLDGRCLPTCYIEVKNVTMKRRGRSETMAEFPDAITARGLKHLAELSRMAEQGYRAVMFYLVQRDDCDRFSIAADIDGNYAEGLKKAISAGVETLCYGCNMSVDEIRLAGPLSQVGL